ncbi:MAG: gliding motility-associated C-terminal domain-containing protein, partial [Sphingobacteriales bacterium]
YTPGDIIVGTKTLVITANNQNKTYGEVLTSASASTAFSATGLENGEIIGSVSIAYGTGSAANAAVGTYDDQGTPSAATGGTFAAANYNITYTPGDIIVGAKALNITANAVNKAYGEVLTAVSGATDFTASGLQNGETVGSVTIAYGTGSAANAAVGTYDDQVTPSAATGGTFTAANYSITYTPGDIIVGTKTLVITATNETKTYGEVLTGASASTAFSSTGLESGETIGSVTIAYGTGSAADAAVGNYSGQVTLSAATGGNFTASNYNITYVDGSIVVEQAALTITAEDKTKTFAAPIPALTAIYTGFVNGENASDLTTQPVLSTTATAGSPVGNYPISVAAAASANYAITFVPGILRVNGRVITVTANAQRKTYGDADPTLSYTYTPELESGDNFTGSLDRAAGENTGSYAITQSSLTLSGNYTLNYVDANLQIDPAVLTVAASNAAICRGSALPAFELSYSGFRFYDSETDLTTRPTVSTTATRNSAPGNYAILPSDGVAGNYSFIYVNGQLTINALPVVNIISNLGLSVSRGATLQLTATGGATYSWANGNGIISGQNAAVLTIRPDRTTTYMVIATNTNGCSESQSITITVNEDYQLISGTNILTPNGDGKNDFLVIRNIDMYPNNEIKIFDIAGRIVFSKRGYDNSWDGKFNGSPLAKGTYYYFIDFGDRKGVKKGFVSIVRD